MYPPPLHHVFHPANADHYAATIGAGLEHLLGALGRVSGPAVGTGIAEAAARVAAVDLDAPLGSTAEALAELSLV